MKRIAPLLLTLFLLASCATGPRIDHQPGHRLDRYISVTLGNMLIMNDFSLSDVKYCVWENTEINACMTEDSVVIITTGLLDRIHTDDEKNYLSAIIAHELAHYKLKHIRNHNIMVLGLWAGFTALDYFIPGAGLATHIVTPLSSKGLSRSYELDADAEAVRIMEKTGHTNADQIYIDSLEWHERKSPSAPGFILWATHPPCEDRVRHIRETFPYRLP